MNERFSVVVPVYRNEGTLCEMAARLSATLRAAMAVDEYELIFVDDASPDGSWRVIESMAAADPHVVGLRLASNVGQPVAYCAGIDAAGGDVLVGLDADLEHPPEAIPQLVGALRDGHDLVVARRVGRAPGPLRLLGSRTVNLLARVVGLSVSDVGSTFVVVTPEVASAMRQVIDRTGRQMLLHTIVGEAARNPTAIDIQVAPNPTSSYSTLRAITLFGEFVVAELVPALARRALLAGGVGLAIAAHPRLRRRALAAGGASTAVGVVGLLLPRVYRRDRTEAMYEVAERVGDGLDPRRPPVGPAS